MPNLVTMVVEIPKGSCNKYEMDAATGEIVLDRMLFTATRYPAGHGLIPDTPAEDGHTLDAATRSTPWGSLRSRPLRAATSGSGPSGSS